MGYLGEELTALNNGLSQFIPADYSNPIFFTNNENLRSGTFTAPRDGFAFCHMYAAAVNTWVECYINDISNGIYVAGVDGPSGVVTVVPMHKGDVITWSSSGSNAYFRSRCVFI